MFTEIALTAQLCQSKKARKFTHTTFIREDGFSSPCGVCHFFALALNFSDFSEKIVALSVQSYCLLAGDHTFYTKTEPG